MFHMKNKKEKVAAAMARGGATSPPSRVTWLNHMITLIIIEYIHG